MLSLYFPDLLSMPSMPIRDDYEEKKFCVGLFLGGGEKGVLGFWGGGKRGKSMTFLDEILFDYLISCIREWRGEERGGLARLVGGGFVSSPCPRHPPPLSSRERVRWGEKLS